MTKPPSLRDVAQAAGVSIGTASRALNNKSNVLPETRAQVLKAATELGYKLQFRVPSSVSTKLNTIGAVMKRDPGQNPRVDPFNYMILTGVENECQKLGINMMYSSIQVDGASHAISKPSILEDNAIDGLVIIGASLSDPEIAHSIPADMPVVLVDAYNPHYQCDTILIDNFGGAYQAVSHLIEKGHTRIAWLGSNGKSKEHPGIRDRREGYLKALEDQQITDVYIEHAELWHSSGYEAAQKLLKCHPEITAIFTCNDDAAVGAMAAIHEMGWRIPDDISVIGFDDTEVAVRATPKLSTMFVDKFLMGVLGVRHLYDRATNLDRVPIGMNIHTRLVERDSVKSLVDRSMPLHVPDT